MNDLQILMAARKLLMAPSRWTKGAWAKHDPDAEGQVCYCALGAVGAAAGVEYQEPGSIVKSSIEKWCYNTEGLEYNSTYQRVAEILGDYVDESLLNEYAIQEGLEETSRSRNEIKVYLFNDRDETTYSDVMELFSRAIADRTVRFPEEAAEAESTYNTRIAEEAVA